jgi:hypothetical protein
MKRLKTDKKGNITVKIVDAELDLIKGTFNYDGCIELDTHEYTHITLSIENLYDMIYLIEGAEKKYNKMCK